MAMLDADLTPGEETLQFIVSNAQSVVRAIFSSHLTRSPSVRFAPQTLASASATAINVCRVDSHSLRIPVVSADPVAAWVAEGGEF